jgi:hypothetical protein
MVHLNKLEDLYKKYEKDFEKASEVLQDIIGVTQEKLEKNKYILDI